jgi:hypothetical protein
MVVIFNIDKVRDKFDFDSKIKCKIKFVSLNKSVEAKLEEYIKKNPGKFSNMLYLKIDKLRSSYCENLITEYLNNNFSSYDLTNNDIGIYEKIIWKTNNIKTIDSEYDNEDSDNENESEIIRRDNRSKIPSDDISRSESISDFNCIINSDRSYKRGSVIYKAAKSNLFSSLRSNNFIDRRNKERMSILTNIDILEIISEYSGTINNTKTFSFRDLPDTRNPRRLNKDTLTRINSYLDTDIHIMNNVRKKDVIWLIIVLFFIFIIVKLI